MREELEKHCRNLRHTGLEITLVPHAATCPVGFKRRTHIIDYIGHHIVGKVTRNSAVAAVAEFVAGSAVYAECSDNRVVHRRAGIGMKCETEVYRNAETFAIGEHRRAAGKPVDP